jgi:hypothetical protein
VDPAAAGWVVVLPVAVVPVPLPVAVCAETPLTAMVRPSAAIAAAIGCCFMMVYLWCCEEKSWAARDARAACLDKSNCRA